MSIYYDFTEVLEAKNIQESFGTSDVIDIMVSQLSLLSTVMTLDLVKVYDMKLVVDGKETTFSGDFYTKKIVKAIRSMYDADTVSLYMRYSYWYYACNENLHIGPFTMMEQLDKCDDSVFDDVSYVSYNLADCSDDMDGGIICSYYKKDGTVHRDVSDFREIDELPDNGYWTTPYSVWALDNAVLSDEDVKYLTELTEKMKAYSYVSENVVTSFDAGEGRRNGWSSLDLAEIKSREEFEGFLSLVGELVKWHSSRPEDEDEDFWVNFVFCDESESGPRILKADFEDDGSCSLEMIDRGF